MKETKLAVLGSVGFSVLLFNLPIQNANFPTFLETQICTFSDLQEMLNLQLGYPILSGNFVSRRVQESRDLSVVR